MFMTFYLLRFISHYRELTFSGQNLPFRLIPFSFESLCPLLYRELNTVTGIQSWQADVKVATSAFHVKHLFSEPACSDFRIIKISAVTVHSRPSHSLGLLCATCWGSKQKYRLAEEGKETAGHSTSVSK